MTNAAIKQTNSIGSDLVLPYLIREPQIKSSKKKGIILLHGTGSNEKDLFTLTHQLPDDFFVISPRGQFTVGAGRYAWYHVDFSTGTPVYDTAQETSSRNILTEFTGQVKQKYNLEEIYLGGFSQGAIMSYSVGLTNPAHLTGLVALSGRLLEELKPFVSINQDLQRLKVFLAHGVDDAILPVQYARTAKSFLEELGVGLTYGEYRAGHQISGEMLADLNAWLR